MSVLNLLNKKFDYPQSTWANRPTRALKGDIVIITDIGSTDELFVYTGTRWAPMNGCIVVGQSNVKVDLTGTTSVTQMGLITVPGGLMGPNGCLEIFHTWSFTNSANNKSLIVRMNGASGTAYFSRSETTSAFQQAMTIIRNVNSTSSQIGPVISLAGSFGTSTGSAATSAINTANNFDIYLSGTLANSGELISLHNVRVVYRE